MSEIQYVKKISRLDRKGLSALWESIQTDSTTGWPPGKAFEYLVLRAFQLEGAEIGWPFVITEADIIGSGSRDAVEQIDGYVQVENIACILECKDRGEKTNVEPIARLRNILMRRSPQVIGVIFSRSEFTEAATHLARFVSPNIILLWGGDEITYALERKFFVKGLKEKLKQHHTKGIPNYNIRLGAFV